ncbi:MAG: hypothetical protein ACPH9N_00295 [Alteromonas sp.]
MPAIIDAARFGIPIENLNALSQTVGGIRLFDYSIIRLFDYSIIRQSTRFVFFGVCQVTLDCTNEIPACIEVPGFRLKLQIDIYL